MSNLGCRWKQVGHSSVTTITTGEALEGVSLLMCDDIRSIAIILSSISPFFSLCDVILVISIEEKRYQKTEKGDESSVHIESKISR